MIEHKAVPVGDLEVIDDEHGIVEAIVSVTGIVDEVRDLIEPGAYTKTLQRRKPKGIWGHAWDTPISKTLDAKELMPGDPELPKFDRTGAPWPAAAGALKVKTQFNLETQRGREAYADVKFFGADAEWSVGYKVPTGQAVLEQKSGQQIRRIREMDLYEYSPVLFGAMPLAATTSMKTAQQALLAVKASLAGQPLEVKQPEDSELETKGKKRPAPPAVSGKPHPYVDKDGDNKCDICKGKRSEHEKSLTYADLHLEAKSVILSEALDGFDPEGASAADDVDELDAREVILSMVADGTADDAALTELGFDEKAIADFGLAARLYAELEAKSRRVRTAAGAKKYNRPIGSPILPGEGGAKVPKMRKPGGNRPGVSGDRRTEIRYATNLDDAITAMNRSLTPEGLEVDRDTAKFDLHPSGDAGTLDFATKPVTVGEALASARARADADAKERYRVELADRAAALDALDLPDGTDALIARLQAMRSDPNADSDAVVRELTRRGIDVSQVPDAPSGSGTPFPNSGAADVEMASVLEVGDAVTAVEPDGGNVVDGLIARIDSDGLVEVEDREVTFSFRATDLDTINGVDAGDYRDNRLLAADDAETFEGVPIDDAYPPGTEFFEGLPIDDVAPIDEVAPDVAPPSMSFWTSTPKVGEPRTEVRYVSNLDDAVTAMNRSLAPMGLEVDRDTAKFSLHASGDAGTLSYVAKPRSSDLPPAAPATLEMSEDEDANWERIFAAATDAGMDEDSAMDLAERGGKLIRYGAGDDLGGTNNAEDDLIAEAYTNGGLVHRSTLAGHLRFLAADKLGAGANSGFMLEELADTLENYPDDTFGDAVLDDFLEEFGEQARAFGSDKLGYGSNADAVQAALDELTGAYGGEFIKFDVSKGTKVLLGQIFGGLETKAGGADKNRGGAETLRRYWTKGPGAAKIGWGTPGDWTRCVSQLSKYLGVRARGYCSLRHREVNGFYPGDAKNKGGDGVFTLDVDDGEALVASLQEKTGRLLTEGKADRLRLATKDLADALADALADEPEDAELEDLLLAHEALKLGLD